MGCRGLPHPQSRTKSLKYSVIALREARSGASRLQHARTLRFGGETGESTTCQLSSIRNQAVTPCDQAYDDFFYDRSNVCIIINLIS